MAITEIEKRAYFLIDIWNREPVVTTEEGLTIISKEMEDEMDRLASLVLKKKHQLSELQKKRAERVKVMGGKLGRERVKLPVSVEEIKKMLKREGATFNGVAKELKINRRTMENRLNEVSCIGDEVG